MALRPLTSDHQGENYMAHAKGCLARPSRVAFLSSSAACLFFIISLPSNLHGHSTLVARAPLPFPRDPRPPSVGRRAEGPNGGGTGNIFFGFARALAVAMAVALAGSHSRPHLPAPRTQKFQRWHFIYRSDGSYLGRAEVRPPNSKGALLIRLLFDARARPRPLLSLLRARG